MDYLPSVDQPLRVACEVLCKYMGLRLAKASRFPILGGIKAQPNAGTPCLAIFICSISLKQAWLMPF